MGMAAGIGMIVVAALLGGIRGERVIELLILA